MYSSLKITIRRALKGPFGKQLEGLPIGSTYGKSKISAEWFPGQESEGTWNHANGRKEK